MTLREIVSLGLFVFMLGWLFIEAPSVWWREIQFVLEILVLTAWTRTTSWRTATAALGWGIGVAVPLMLAIGWLFRWIGVDIADGAMGWAIVPVVEEIVKLLPVLLLAALYCRQRREFNLSDWLLAGCAAGAGFALVENIELVINSDVVLHDMSLQYGPHLGGFYVIPGAWGSVGFIGHAAATGIASVGIGVSLALKRRGPAQRVAPLAWLRRIPAPWWSAAAVTFAWVALEHTLANVTVDTGSAAGKLLGNGQLTPWLTLPLFAMAIAIDFGHRRDALARSAIFRMHFALIRAAWRGTSVAVRKSKTEIARAFFQEVRQLNAAAWATFDTRPN